MFEFLAAGAAITGLASTITGAIGGMGSASASADLSKQYAAQEMLLNQRASQITYEASAKSVGINKQILGYERDIEKQRLTAMEVDARRRSLEILRNQQRARSLALTTATAQGSGKSSALQGAYGQISGATGSNLTGVSQNLEIGRNIFGLNSQITDKRIDYNDLQLDLARQQAEIQTQKARLLASYQQQGADIQSDAAMWQGFSQIGSALTSAATPLFNFGITAQNAFPSLGTLFGGAGQPLSLAPPNPYNPQPGAIAFNSGTGPRGLY